MDTLLLTLDAWDLCLDAGRNIARASVPYARAQDVASAIKTFLGEVYYDTSLGIPYFETVLGKLPPITVFQELMVQAALTVPGVVSARCVINSFDNRTVSGQVTFTDSTGATQSLTL